MNKIQPAYLFVGSPLSTEIAAHSLISHVLCNHAFTESCFSCSMLTQRTHPQIMHISPSPRYTLNLFDNLFKKIEFTLDLETHFFFFIHEAHLLSTACANALLKIVEEPPTGYHFIFTTHHLESVILTIRSRCAVERTHATDEKNNAKHPLVHFFTQSSDPLTFLNYLSKTTITEIEVQMLLDHLLKEYTYKIMAHNDDVTTESRIQFLELLKKNIHTSVMPGSGKLLLKELFLQKSQYEIH